MYYKGLEDFSPCDDSIILRYKALYLLNTLRKLGLNTRKKFVDTCVTYISLNVNSTIIDKVRAFWDGRDVTLIAEMEKIVEQLNDTTCK